ncbi:MAG: hypothetical protein ACI9VR_000405 [Cognaticolwellia sp.]
MLRLPQKREGFGLPVFALAWSLALLVPLGCSKGETDSDPPDSGSVVETGSPLEDEICDSGADEDIDGLIDCADPDCTNVCEEICTNDVDDDADGFVDCLDSECELEAPCLKAYTVTSIVRFDTLELRFGSGVQAEYGELGTADGVGSVVLNGVANSALDSDFSCEGNLVAQPVADGGPFPAFAWSEQSCPECDFGLRFEVSPLWPGTCPVVTLPVQILGVQDGTQGVYWEQAGSWELFYQGTGTWKDQGGDRVVNLVDVTQQAEWIWQGDY